MTGLVLLCLLATPAFAFNKVKPVMKPADMRGRFAHALRFHEKGLAQLAAAQSRTDAKSAGATRVGSLYRQLEMVHLTGVRIAKAGLRRATLQRGIPAREDAHAEASAHMAETMANWSAASSLKQTVVELGRAINAVQR